MAVALLLGRQHAALELERTEAPAVHHPPGLGDQLVGIERFAPEVGLLAGVPGPLVEEVAAERHPVADGATEQVAHRTTGLPAGEVEARDLERGVHGVDR